ncbi:MAG: DUF302 domain-containing protein [Proteobacteria bacterium]|jgi:uncharacterized protein (DUF302 family)|nr:DUF302 domain-containing protein [Pseudomonadota bacterium]
MNTYVIGKKVALGFAEAEQRITEELGKVGFGILTEIDVAATMKKKLGVEMPPYRILGACNPHFAHQAIGAEPQIGALLPCNAVVRQDAGGAVHIELMDPNAVLGLVGRPEVTAVAAQVRQRLEQALAAV